MGVLLDHTRKPSNLTLQNSTSPGIGQKYSKKTNNTKLIQIDPNCLKESNHENLIILGVVHYWTTYYLDHWLLDKEIWIDPFLPNKLFWGWGTTRQPQKINSLTMPNLAKLTSPWIVQTYYIEPNWIQIDPNCIQIASKRQTLRITMNYLLNYLFFRTSTYHRLLGKETWIGSFLPK